MELDDLTEVLLWDTLLCIEGTVVFEKSGVFDAQFLGIFGGFFFFNSLI